LGVERRSEFIWFGSGRCGLSNPLRSGPALERPALVVLEYGRRKRWD